jgi:hypothetical protein
VERVTNNRGVIRHCYVVQGAKTGACAQGRVQGPLSVCVLPGSLSPGSVRHARASRKTSSESREVRMNFMTSRVIVC